MKSRKRPADDRATELSVHEALWRYMQQAPLPFAIVSGVRHTLKYANSAFCRLAGVESHDALGAPITAAFGFTERPALSAVLNRALRDRVELLDERIVGSRGRMSGWKFSAADDALDLQRQIAEQMLLGALRERGFAEGAEAARRRAAFLAEAGRLLAESVDRTSTLTALTRLALPALGAWCIVDILEEGDAIRRLGIYHPDPEKQKLAQRLEGSWSPKADDPFGAPAMLRAASTLAITDGIESALSASARSPDNLRTLRELGIGSLLTVPLVARNKLLGAITFVNPQPGFSYTPEDVQLAEDVATRGALALDSAQVYDLALVHERSAETANKAKTAFLGAMSHELRTPLNAIGGYIDLLDMGLRGPVTESQRADFARVRDNQRHLAVLITEILNFVRVESGQVSYVARDVRACDALQHTIELIEPLFGQNRIVFDGITGDASIVATADPERVTQILVNLLSNAIKFTPAGGHISAACAAKGDTVTLRISDTGIGIPVEKQETIFEPFVQLKEGYTGREGGVGLGLAISRDLARAMSGNLTVESSEGAGARFTLSLPRAGEN